MVNLFTDENKTIIGLKYNGEDKILTLDIRWK